MSARNQLRFRTLAIAQAAIFAFVLFAHANATAAFASSAVNATLSGGSGTAVVAGTQFAKSGAALTLTVVTDLTMQCVQLSGANSGSLATPTSSDATSRTWQFAHHRRHRGRRPAYGQCRGQRGSGLFDNGCQRRAFSTRSTTPRRSSARPPRRVREPGRLVQHRRHDHLVGVRYGLRRRERPNACNRQPDDEHTGGNSHIDGYGSRGQCR